MAKVMLIGTSHISKQSIDKVRKAIRYEAPDVVAVELDKQRYYALVSKPKKQSYFYSIRRVGLTGFLFALFGQWGSKKLGKITGISPGSEMIAAIRLSKKSSIRVALIDQDINLTLFRLTRAIKVKDKVNFFVDIIRGIFQGKKMAKELGLDKFNISNIPGQDVVVNIINYMKKRYPALYKVLIYERNLVLAKNIFILSNNFNRVVAVVGAGHVPGIKRLLEKKYGIDDIMVY